MEKRSARHKKNAKKKSTLDKNKKLSRMARLKKRKRRIIGLTTLITVIIVLLLGGILINNAYVSNKCSDLTYAVDHYFTKWKDSDLRLKSVQTMDLLEKTDTSVKVEAFGLAYKEPHARTTLVGTFIKKNGSWKMENVEVKAPSN